MEIKVSYLDPTPGLLNNNWHAALIIQLALLLKNDTIIHVFNPHNNSMKCTLLSSPFLKNYLLLKDEETQVQRDLLIAPNITLLVGADIGVEPRLCC